MFCRGLEVVRMKEIDIRNTAEEIRLSDQKDVQGKEIRVLRFSP